jgi:hypothetical protein
MLWYIKLKALGNAQLEANILVVSTDFSQRKTSTDNFTEPIAAVYRGG